MMRVMVIKKKTIIAQERLISTLKTVNTTSCENKYGYKSQGPGFLCKCVFYYDSLRIITF